MTNSGAEKARLRRARFAVCRHFRSAAPAYFWTSFVAWGKCPTIGLTKRKKESLSNGRLFLSNQNPIPLRISAVTPRPALFVVPSAAQLRLISGPPLSRGENARLSGGEASADRLPPLPPAASPLGWLPMAVPSFSRMGIYFVSPIKSNPPGSGQFPDPGGSFCEKKVSREESRRSSQSRRGWRTRSRG